MHKKHLIKFNLHLRQVFSSQGGVGRVGAWGIPQMRKGHKQNKTKTRTEISLLCNRQEKERKDMKTGKKEAKLSIPTDNIITYAETPKESTKQPQEQVNLARLRDTTSLYKNQLYFKLEVNKGMKKQISWKLTKELQNLYSEKIQNTADRN